MNRRSLGTIVRNPNPRRDRLMLGVPLTGTIRAEWAMARYGQAAPTNWSLSDITVWLDQYSPLGHTVPDARNLIVSKFVESGTEWLFFLDHDVVLPPKTWIKLNSYMQSSEYPTVNGLYFTKSNPAEPLIYRGLGTSFYRNWKLGQKVWADGTGLGCTLIHSSIMKAIYEESEDYTVAGVKLRRVFRNPAESSYDIKRNTWSGLVGTEDLDFYKRLQSDNIYKKAGWSKFQRKKYPLLIDTSIFCRHIDMAGTLYPAHGEELYFMSDDTLRKELAFIEQHGPQRYHRAKGLMR